MKRTVLLTIFVLASVSPLHGQSLDIGGIELRLGQSATEAAKALGTVYDVRFYDELKMWSAFEKRRNDSDLYHIVGSFSVGNNLITSISRSYDVAEGWQLMKAFTTAQQDIRRRTSAPCATSADVYTNKNYHTVETVCGRYTVQLSLGYKQSDGSNMMNGVSLSVK